MLIFPVKLLHKLNAKSPIIVTELGKIKFPVKLLQPENAAEPIEINPVGSGSKDNKFLQLEKALSPIDTIDAGNFTDLRYFLLKKALAGNVLSAIEAPDKSRSTNEVRLLFS